MDSFQGITEQDEQRAVALYAVLTRDAGDFLDMLGDASNGTLKMLYLLFATPNPKMTRWDAEWNEIGLKLLEPVMTRKGVQKPPVPEPDSEG